MADSLLLKGVKDVREQTGTEMVYMSNPRGGDTYKFPKWKNPSAGTKVNVDCTRFLVTTGAGSCNLLIMQSGSERVIVRITHDGSFGFTFSEVNDLKEVALFTDQWELIESYSFQPDPSAPVIVTAGSGSKPTAFVGPTEPEEEAEE